MDVHPDARGRHGRTATLAEDRTDEPVELVDLEGHDHDRRRDTDVVDVTDAALTGTTVVVCDPRPIVLAGLASVLAGPGLLGRSDPAGAPDAVDRLEPEVLVAGLRIDDPSTFQAVARVKGGRHAPRVLLVADAATVTELREAVIAGVDSFLLTSAPAGELRDAVTRTARGERIISPSIAMQLAGGWQRDEDRPGAAALSPRELDVLGLLAEGMTNQQIGEELDLSPRTVKTHVQNLLAKLGSPDRTGAVARGFRLGLIR